MIHEYAMGTGITSLRMASETASEATRKLRDDEVRELADEAFRAATKIIDMHRPQLDELAATLLSNEVLERADINRIMGDTPNAAPRRIGGGELGLAAATAVSPADPPARR
jgi:ATP-dependent Zn protease